MPLSAATRLGPYEIVAMIGAGGMGEVYRARDPRMGRDVAIKVSAERFSDRFEREVRAVAALNHPNICQIYDVGPNYLVMELVEGPTLAERIKGGALPRDTSLTIARQISDALETAHEKGIIHRDLKPANIKIKPDGTVKVLDFGLAKMAEPVTAAANPEDSPTLTIEATRMGQILGTPAYMAPEQARGKPVDKRVDIWAFGVVLYEMLTGRALFSGETVSDTLAGVLTREPDWTRVPAKTQRLLENCLEKDPKRRLRDIGDAWRLLDDAPQLFHAKSTLPWAAAGVLALAPLALVAMLWRTPRGAAPPAVRLDIDLGAPVSPLNVGASAILSPDAGRVVFVSQSSDGKSHLSTRRLDDTRVTELPGTESAFGPFFSPDGQWVGFFAGAKLKKTRVDGGEPVVLCDAPAARGASWSEDGSIFVNLTNRGGLFRIPAEGGAATLVTDINEEAGEQSYRWPQVLPGGRAVLFTAATAGLNYSAASIMVFSLADHRKKLLMPHAGMYPRYVPSGHIVYVKQATLFAVPFDLDHLEIRGSAAPVFDEVSGDTGFGFAQFDFSRTGVVLYRKGRTEGLWTIQWLDSSGKTEPILNEPAIYMVPSVSPDGGRIAAAVSDGMTSAIWVYDLQRGQRIRLTPGSAWDVSPVWSPDGQYLVYWSESGLSWVRADGANGPQPFLKSKHLLQPRSFSPDGKRLAYDELTPGGGTLLRTVEVAGGSSEPHAGEPQTFLEGSSNPYPAFSPDGRWMAYADTQSGTSQVYVRAFPDRGTKWQVSTDSGTMPVWSPKGHELFYRTVVDHRIMVASYSVNLDSFVPGKPRLWSRTPIANTGQSVNFGIAPDGRRFAVLMPPHTQAAAGSLSHVTLVLNFFDEVRRRVAGHGK